ncbi:MAG: DNA polymerase III subunit delta', partial [Aquificota bacterium]
MIQKRVREFLGKLFYQKKVPHSLLFYGKEGVGKKDIAFEFAKSLLCLKEVYPPCGECPSCKHMDHFTKAKP